VDFPTPGAPYTRSLSQALLRIPPPRVNGGGFVATGGDPLGESGDPTEVGVGTTLGMGIGETGMGDPTAEGL